MVLTNEHNPTCTRIIGPAIKNIESYDWGVLQNVIYGLFNMSKTSDVDMWYTLILVNDRGNLYFAFTQELNKPKVGDCIKYQRESIKVVRTGRDDGHHGWCKLIIVEGKK